MIPDSFIEELRQRCDMEQIAAPYVLLKRAGRHLKGLCPFHSEKSPSFIVYPESQSFYCFGCGAGGDVITFIRRIENLEYLEAVKFLAERCGMKLPEDVQKDETGHLRLRILEMNREAARFFHAQLVSGPDKRGIEYLAQRGMDPRMLKKFGLGYAPQSWDALKMHLHSKGYTQQEMLAAALVQDNRKCGSYDAFRGRIIFPILDLRGNVIGFGGRVLPEGSGPKYLNSGDTLAFKKSRNLFALNFAKNTKEQRLVLAEGYMDVVSIYQGGFDNAVATLGTALTPEQARLISHYTKEVLIAYDSDEAGQAATRRAVKLFEELGIQVKVLSIQGAKDPDEYLKKFGSTRFRMLMDGSSNATEYAIGKLQEQYALDTEDGKVQFLTGFCRLIADLQSPVERDVYISKWAAQLGVSRDAVAEQVRELARKKAASQRRKETGSLDIYSQNLDMNKKDVQRSKYLQYALAEDKLIQALWKHNDFYAHIVKQIAPEEFVTDSNRKIFTELCRRLQENKNTDIIAFAGVLEDTLISRLSWLVAQAEEGRFQIEQVDEYIAKIKAFALKKEDAQLAGMSTSEYTDYLKALAEKKRR